MNKNLNPALRRKKLLSLISNKSDKTFNEICKFLKTDSSSVLRHEAAFLVGTFSKNKKASEILIETILADKSDLVRHEAIEALGDVGVKNNKVKKVLYNCRNDKNIFIQETAEIALLTLEL